MAGFDSLKKLSEGVATRGSSKNKPINAFTTRQYDYVAMSPNGTRQKGRMEAPSQRAVSEALQAEGWIPLEVKEINSGALNKDLSSMLGGGSGDQKIVLTVAEASAFFRQVSELLRAGVPIARVLTALGEEASPKMKTVCKGLGDRLQSGVPLSEAMLAYPDAFDGVTRAYVAAGEAAGTLPETMSRLAKILEKRNQMRLKVKAVTAYPKMVGGAIGVVVGAILIFLVPRFQSIYADFGSELPLPTKILVVISENLIPIKPELSFPMPFFLSGESYSIIDWLGRVLFLVGFIMGTDALSARSGKTPKWFMKYIKWLFAIVVTIFAKSYTVMPISLVVWGIGLGAFFGIKMFLSSKTDNPKLIRFIDRTRFRLPVMGTIIKKNALYQWASTMAGALNSGVPLTQTLALAGDTSGSRWHAMVAAELEDAVRAGKPLSEAMAMHTDLYPANIRAMVSTGETTGDLSTMFESISDTIDSEIESAVAGLSAKVEVLLLLVMAVIVGGLLIALYMPIIQLATAAGGSG